MSAGTACSNIFRSRSTLSVNLVLSRFTMSCSVGLSFGSCHLKRCYMTPVCAENHCLLFRRTMQWLLICVLSFKNMVEHVGHVIVGLSMDAPGSICFLQSMQVYVQINSLIATMKV